MSNAMNLDAAMAESQPPKLKFPEKLSAVLNGGMGTFHHQVIQMFLLFFYTDGMKVNAAFVAVLFLVCRFIDAFLTPAFGIFVDRSNTRWGKYKPWYIGATLIAGVLGWLSFTNFGMDGTAKYVYVTVTYLLYSIFLSIGQGPGGGLVPAMTKRLDDRMSIGQIGYFVIVIGAMLAQIAVQPLYKTFGHGDICKGFSIVMGVVAVVGILGCLLETKTIHERYITPAVKHKEGPSMKDMAVAVFTNKTALIVYAFTFGTNLANGIRTGISIYYFKYYFHNDMLVTISGMVSILPVMIGVVLSKRLTKKIGVKKNVLLNAIVGVISTALFILCPPNQIGVILYMVLLCVISFFSGLSQPAQGTMMPAAMDYTEWKTGMNVNSFMGSVNGFLQSASTALSGTITAGSLALVGYAAGAAQQSAGTLMGFRIMVSIIPAIATALTLTVCKYDLTEEKQTQITKELMERRKSAEVKKGT